MRMTVGQLHKRLGKLIEQGHIRKPVCVAKDTFRHNCEGDGVTILEVAGLGIESILHMGDGDSTERADGTERRRSVCVLVGSSGANSKGEIVSEQFC